MNIADNQFQTQFLILSLYRVARANLASANQGNPFISKSEAMRDINQARVLIRARKLS